MNPSYPKHPTRPYLVSGVIFAIALFAGFAGSASVSLAARETVILNDQFTSGNLVHAEEVNSAWYFRSAAWYFRSAPTTFAVNSNGLDYRPFTTASSTRVIVGVIPDSATLGSNVGDILMMSFTFSITDTKRTDGGNLAGASDAFAFGLYHSRGAPITGNNFTNDVNHAGYLVKFGMGSSTPGLSIQREDGGSSRPMFGSDLVTLPRNETLTPASIPGTTTAAEVMLKLKRLAGGQVSLTFSFNGTSSGSVTDSGGGVVSSFDEVMFNVTNGWAVRLTDIKVSTIRAHPEIIYPANAGVIDVTKHPYNAKGDGITDDTAAINAALRDNNAGSNFVDNFMSSSIYFPEGVYIVSDTLEPKDAGDPNKNQCSVRFIGQSRDKTIIKLKDNAAKFQDAMKPRYIIRTGNRDGALPNAGYGNYIQHLTVDGGAGNPGAIGVRFDVANCGAIDNVRITSSDPDKRGRYGLAFEGPCGLGYVKNVAIEGFDCGIYLDKLGVNNIAFENIRLSHQRECGIRNLSKSIQIIGLQSYNNVPAVHVINPRAAVFLLNATLNRVDENDEAAAIVSDSSAFFYLRDITASGYGNVIQVPAFAAKEVPAGNSIDEWWSHDAPFMQGEVPASLRLPIKSVPEYFNDDLSQWANVESYGAKKNDDAHDDAPGIQAAIDSGKPIVYFPRGIYTLKSDVTVRGKVRKLDFLFSKVNYVSPPGVVTAPSIRIGEVEGDAVILENITQHIAIIHNGSKAAIIRNRGGAHPGIIQVGEQATGNLFVENAGPHAIIEVRNGIHVWLRAVNREKSGLLNDGSTVWSFADNIETMRTISGNMTIRPMKTINGGRTEIIGACMDALDAHHAPSDGALIENIDSTVSANFAGEIRIKDGIFGRWPILIRNIANGETSIVPEEDAIFFTDSGDWPERFVIPMYRTP